MEIYYLVEDLGDGSSKVVFFKNRETAEKLFEHSSFATNNLIRSFSIQGVVRGITFYEEK